MPKRRQGHTPWFGHWRTELSGLEHSRDWLVAALIAVLFVLVALVIAFVAFG